MKFTKVTTALALAVFFCASVPFAEEVSSKENPGVEEEDLTFRPFEYFFGNPSEHHYIIGITGMLFSDAALFWYNKNFIGSGWTQVTPDDWAHFYENEWEFDNDWYWTDFFLHPYQGTFYYMSGRNANFTPFESWLLAMAGSWIWENFCELNEPAINDFAYSTIGASILGEMLYRLSFEAQNLNYYASYLVNPMRMWTDFLTQEKQPARNSALYSLDGYVGFKSATGALFAEDFDQKEQYPASGGAGFNFVYNDPYSADSNRMMNQFDLSVSGYAGKGSGKGMDDGEKNIMYGIKINSDGFLFSRTPASLNEGNTRTSAGASLVYDFNWHSYFNASALGLGAGLKQKVEFSENNILEWKEVLAYNILGTTDYAYFRRDILPHPEKHWREFSYTTGAVNIAALKWTLFKKNIFALQTRAYAHYVFPWQDLELENYFLGWEFQTFADFSYEYMLSDSVSLGLQDELYFKASLYEDDAPDFRSIFNSVGVFARLKLK